MLRSFHLRFPASSAVAAATSLRRATAGSIIAAAAAAAAGSSSSLPSSSVSLVSSARFCSASASSSDAAAPPPPAATEAPPAAAAAPATASTEAAPPAPPAATDAAAAAPPPPSQLDQILEEVRMLLDEALPIGTLFKALSSDSRNFISGQRISFETFLLRYPQMFSVFKQTSGHDRSIFVCKAGLAPTTASHAQEVAGTTIGFGNLTDSKRARIYTVLRYIPNEWASYVALPIPEDVKKRIIRKPAKNFFEANVRYFEVRFNPKFGHTFEVRRSEMLQKFMAEKAKMQPKK